MSEGSSSAAPAPRYLRRFLLLQAIGWSALASWHLDPSRALWDTVDLWFFEKLNDTLGWSTGWQILIALASHRAFDLVAALCFLYLYVHHAMAVTGGARLHRLCQGGVICGWAALTLSILARVLEVERLSPTLVVDGARRLTELVPFVRFKDVSSSSFPGDHGTALIIFTTLGWVWMGARLGLAALALSLVFVLPRLLSGAHWLTDVTVGSVLCAALSLSLALGTPVGDWLIGIAYRVLAPVWARLTWLGGTRTDPKGA